MKADYDIVGFSFFTYEIPKIKEMVRLARKSGVEEVWEGHYGVLTYGIQDIFDKTFVGYAERKVAEALNIRLDRVKHPYLVDLVGLPGKLRAFPIGVLFTSRGCHLECEFCQTPVFCPESTPVPFESLRETVLEYKQDGISEILIPEEHFGLQKRHTENVIDLLDESGMNWYAQTIINILHKELDDWYEKGLSGAMLGIEGLRQDQVNSVNKKIDVDKTISLLGRLKEKKTFIIGNYMIGFEDDTGEIIKRCISRLTEFSIGIIENDWGKWDTKHLVWNHPNISQDKMKELLIWCFNKAYPRYRVFQNPMKFYKLHSHRYISHGERFSRFKTDRKIFSDLWKANLRFEEPPIKI
ncbi:MAG: radical SAM protein [Candidatus Saliniplasma sp.]